MAASYPTSIASFATKSTGDTIQPGDVNGLQDEVVAMETGLENGFQHNLIPLTDNLKDLGDSAHAWKNLWTKGTTQFNGIAYTWPGADGSSGQVLQTNGSKTLSWITPASPSFIVQNGFRLTLTSATPVTTADVTGATGVYFTPYLSRCCTVFDSSGNGTTLVSGQISIAMPATTNQMYDVFVYNSSGTLTLELLAWTNDSTRATALNLTASNDATGVLTKTGDASRRYVGTVRTTGVSGQTEDSAAKRYVWNYYNRVRRLMQRLESTSTWLYGTNTIRQANGAAANQLDFVVGMSEGMVHAAVTTAGSATAAGFLAAVLIGLDSTTAAAATAQAALTYSQGNTQPIAMTATYDGYPGIGRHTLVWLELGGNGTQTWYGTTNNVNGGISGWIDG